jgi:dTDP-4-dehydrorhamnose reductase
MVTDVTNFLREIKPDIILHTAAATNIDECETHHKMAHENNVTVPETLAIYAQEHSAKLIHISTDTFF